MLNPESFHIDDTALVLVDHQALMVHLRMQPGASANIEPPAGATVLAYALAGSAEVNGYAVPHAHLFGGHDAREPFTIDAGSQGAELFVCAATPIGEPVVAAGPFVMTTRDEIAQAYDDFRSGRLDQ